MPLVLQGRLATTRATRESMRAVDLSLYAAGTNATHQDNGLELLFRDTHTASHHIPDLDSNFECGGQFVMSPLPSASVGTSR